MKTKILLLTTAVLISTLSSVYAKPRDCKPGDDCMRMESKFNDEAFFSKVDTNKDGQLSKDEIQAFKEKGPRNKMFEDLDANNDDKISKDEFNVKSEERFNKMDANSDGFIDKEEAKKHRKRMMNDFKERDRD